MNYETLLIAFGAAFILEFLAFGMQRATLLMSREAGVAPQIGALLLPSWFPIVWLFRLVKWAILCYIAFAWSCVVAGGLLAADFVLSAILPIPYSAYLSAFRSRINGIKASDADAGHALEQMLNSSKIQDT